MLEPRSERPKHEESCGAPKWGHCETPTNELSPLQLVPAGTTDGRRLYIHEISFHDLATRGRNAATLIFRGLVALPVVKLVHHDLVQEAVAIHGFDEKKANALQVAIGARWFDAITATLRRIGTRSVKLGPRPLLAKDEEVVATCLDSCYYTFATTERAATRMYADVLKLRSVRALVRQGGDAYRDLTMVRGRRLMLVPAEPEETDAALSAEDLQDLKLRVMQNFESDLDRLIAETIPSPASAERECLRQFQQKCRATVRTVVLRLR